jgi:hypothetical protein
MRRSGSNHFEDKTEKAGTGCCTLSAAARYLLVEKGRCHIPLSSYYGTDCCRSRTRLNAACARKQ